MSQSFEVVVAGHVCLDIFPAFSDGSSLETLLAPGKLVETGPASLATGGAVPNTGVALHRLGARVLLRGTVGADPFGRTVLELLRQHAPQLADGMRVADGVATSYSLVISPPGADRCFLHCPGANAHFGADDLDYAQLRAARLFHFGYPPLMRRIFLHDGQELACLLQRVKALGLTTTLDMARPDPNSEAGRVNWPAVLKNVLPHADIFLPSLDELVFMLDRAAFEQFEQNGGVAQAAQDTGLISRLAARVLELGAAMVAIKLGDQGLYLATTGDAARLQRMGRCAPQELDAWRRRELRVPCFDVQVAGTTGSGDCTIAGLLLGILRGWTPEKVLTVAVAVGASSVEKADATSGVPRIDLVLQRLENGWKRRPLASALPGWIWHKAADVWTGPADRGLSDKGQ